MTGVPTEREQMLRGELYNGFDAQLLNERAALRLLTKEYNSTTNLELEARVSLLRKMFRRVGDNVWIEPPFFCDYGINIEIGNGVFVNFHCVILDCNRVKIGDGTLIGPAVQIYTASHPTDPSIRKAGLEYAKPITIGKNVWIGGGVIICPGVTIGDNSAIGAGSVVVRDIPTDVIAVGNPCRVIRTIPTR